MARANGSFATSGDAQRSLWVVRNSTSDATPTEVYSHSTTRVTVPSDTSLAGTINIAGRTDGGVVVAHYVRKFSISNDGGTTALDGSVSTVGTDYEAAAGYDVAVTASDANDALIITVTGVAATDVRWVGSVDTVHISYP